MGCDLETVFVAQPVDAVEHGWNVLERPAGFRVDGVNRTEHLGGEQNVVYPDF